MDKGIGFNRSIALNWLDAAAEMRIRSNDLETIRGGLMVVVGRDLSGVEAIRKTVDILVNIWHKSVSDAHFLLEEALDFYPRLPIEERIWLHYGLSLISYPFFRQCAASFGQYGRIGESIPGKVIKERLSTDMGQIGSVGRATRHVVASLSHWGILVYNPGGHLYTPQVQSLKTKNTNLEVWLLTCALYAHPAEELSFFDLLRSLELFPFKLTVTVDHLRRSSHLILQRQGSWDMVRFRQVE